MCGLVGVVGNIGFNERKAFETLLMLDTIRGHHSTGVVVVSGAKLSPEIVKKVGTPWELFDSKSYESLMKGDLRALIGHNRWATKGKVNSSNAHPFNHGNIYGSHNGTLVSQYGLEGHLNFEVDSDNLYYDMSVNGVEETIPKVNGAYALTWFDSDLNSVNLLRNNQRPLFLAKTSDGKCTFWASELWMLLVALDKNNIKHNGVEGLPVMEQYSFHLTTGISMPCPTPVITEHEEYKVKTVYTAPAAVNNSQVTKLQSFVGKSIEFSISKEKTNEFGVKFLEAEGVDKECPPIRLYCHNNSVLFDKLLRSTSFYKGNVAGFITVGGYLTVNTSSIEEVVVVEQSEDFFFVGTDYHSVDSVGFMKAVSCGCSWCQYVPESSEHMEIHWMQHGFLCPTCAEEPELKSLTN